MNGSQTETPYPSSRAAAKQAQSRFYLTGTACKHGHLSKRYTVTARCVVCALAQSIRWRRDNPDFLSRLDHDKKLDRDRRYTERHREALKARERAAYAANPIPKRTSVTNWQKRNPLKVTVRCENQRARRAKAEGFHTADDIARIRRCQHNKCAWCKISFKTTKAYIDHIAPIARGGSNWPRNIQLLCRPCNQRKHALDPIEWAQRNGRLL